jgi:hypothetical protein
MKHVGTALALAVAFGAAAAAGLVVVPRYDGQTRREAVQSFITVSCEWQAACDSSPNFSKELCARDLTRGLCAGVDCDTPFEQSDELEACLFQHDVARNPCDHGMPKICAAAFRQR